MREKKMVVVIKKAYFITSPQARLAEVKNKQEEETKYLDAASEKQKNVSRYVDVSLYALYPVWSTLAYFFIVTCRLMKSK